jgi:hypothetical protein
MDNTVEIWKLMENQFARKRPRCMLSWHNILFKSVDENKKGIYDFNGIFKFGLGPVSRANIVYQIRPCIKTTSSSV